MKLKDQIKKHIRKGHDVVKIHDALLKKGFLSTKIHEAIDVAYEEIEYEKKRHHDIKTLLMFRKSKLILPLIIFTIIIIHVYSNFALLPDLGLDMCNSVKTEKKLNAIILNDSTIDKFGKLEGELFVINSDIIDKFKTVLSVNMPLVLTKANWLNPFFPTPCESRGFIASFSCRYYISESNYDCLKDDVQDTKLGFLFQGETPKYKQISYLGLMFHMSLLIIISYLVNALLIMFYHKHRPKLSLRQIELFEFAMAVFAICLVLWAIFMYFNAVGLVS